MSYIIEHPAGMPDWVEIGIKVMVKNCIEDDWEGPYRLAGYDSMQDNRFLTLNGCNWFDAKPYTPRTPKKGEWCAFWDDGDYAFMINRFSNKDIDGYLAIDFTWDYCARITNEDGTLIDIRCTVDELKAKTDWLGPEEN